MKKVSKEQLKLREEFGAETGLVFFENVAKYADWLEERYAALRIHDVVGRSEQLLCPICSSDNIDAEFNHYNFCRDCNHDWAK
jgi:hypothetical protein